ncbi:ArsR family transcriptional regulator, partial [Halobacteriales archaeon SW_12_71_31]
SVADPGTAGGLPPGLLFFLGGLSVLLVVVAVAHWSGR